MLQRLTDYFRGVRGEIRRVSWPTRSEVISFTALIILLVIVLTFYIWGVDTILQILIRFLSLL
ncbi:preprotein translocase subunit SecE [Candidatus Bipolaricaulota bacterium]|nr:preprotein translocase subunit SecE [Candidatus Bipolaricaulota bacterium]